MSGATVVLGALGALLALVGVVSIAFTVARSKQVEQTMQILNDGIAARDTELAYERGRREDAERRCAQEVAHLSGQVEALQSSVVQKVTNDVTAAAGRVITQGIAEMTEAFRAVVLQRDDERRTGGAAT